ncbi:TPA: sialidase family protein [Acinetobacter baumannii]|uniref:sialidase family protein n=1 Tax=Acinetobacter baumannii TaxID=470 RepID=UPI0036FF114E
MATNWNAVLANVNNAADILSILRKVLGQLDGKVDLTKIDEIISDLDSMKIGVDTALSDVLSALVDFDNASQEALQQVIQSGLIEGFATEAELLATRPTVLKKYAKAEDTKVIWFWNKPEGAQDGNYWIKTGLSELDQSKKYTDEKTSEVENTTKDFATNAALIAAGNLSKTGSKNLIDFHDKNGDIPAALNEFGEFEAQDFKNENGSFNTVVQSITRQSLRDFTHIDYDADGNIIFGIKKDGSFTTANPSLKYGLSDLRAGSVPEFEIQALGIALDQNATENDTPYSFEIEVSPYQADGTQAQRMATAIKIGPNKLYVAFTQFSVYNNDQQDGRLVARTVDYDLANKTATVSATIPIIGNPTGNNYRHPNFIRLRDRILLILNGNTPDLLVYESLDNCATWQFKTQIDTTSVPEMPWALALDSVVRIEEGPYAGRIVAGLFYYSANSKIGTVFSDDNGVTWQRGTTINSADYFPTYPTLNEMSVVCDAHNDLIFAIRNETLATEARYIIFAKSTDGGKTLQFFNQNIKTPTVGVQIGLKQIAPNSFSGGVPKIIATHPVGNNRTQFILRVSYDGCTSWAYDYKPWPMTEMVGYSSLIPLSAKDFALVVEKGPMLKEQSVAIKFLNLKEIM